MIRRPIPLLLASFWVTALVLPVSCGGGTGGRIVSIEWAVHGVPEEGLPLGDALTDLGWHVRLEDAWIAMGPMYAHAAEGDRLARGLGELLLPGRAWAHAGHDHGFDRVRAEWLERTAVNALEASPRSLGWTTAEAGPVDRMEVTLGPYGGTDGPEALRGGALWVRGEAEREGVHVPFEGMMTFEDGVAREVDPIEASAVLDEGGRLTVGVRPGLWFQGAHFDRLEPEGSEPARMIPGTQVHNAVYLGIRNPRAFVIGWTSGPQDGDVE